jgi:hypothetical protein
MESPLTKQRGEFTGSYNAASGYYTGTYTNAVGELHRDLNPGIEYTSLQMAAGRCFPSNGAFPRVSRQGWRRMRFDGRGAPGIRQHPIRGAMSGLSASVSAAPVG